MSVRFHLPNFVDRFNGSMNMTLISMIKRMPRMFYDGVEIASVFRLFPHDMERRTHHGRIYGYANRG